MFYIILPSFIQSDMFTGFLFFANSTHRGIFVDSFFFPRRGCSRVKHNPCMCMHAYLCVFAKCIALHFSVLNPLTSYQQIILKLTGGLWSLSPTSAFLPFSPHLCFAKLDTRDFP